MRLEYLPDGSPECPLIRLYSFTEAEAGILLKVFVSLSTGALNVVAIHELPFVEPVSGCKLTFRLGSNAEAVNKLGETDFVCVLDASGFERLAELTRPLAKCCGGYQWLATEGDAQILLSGDGCW